MENFCAVYNLKSLIKEPTCFKNLNKPTCIDLILTNHPKSFQNSSVFETGLSDFHKLTFTVLKKYFNKQKPTVIKYRDRKHFNNELFRNELIWNLSLGNLQSDQFDKFKEIITNILDKHAPIKEKHVRSNQAAFINNDIRKAIMTRSRLLNRYRKNKLESSRLEYNKQRNRCVKMLRETKKEFYNNLEVKSVTDNRRFWKTIKPNFSDKSLKDEKITLVENDKIVSEDSELAKIFNDYFSNIVKNLNIERIDGPKQHLDPVINAIKMFENHPSILKINESINKDEIFSFAPVSTDDIRKEIENLDSTKSTQGNDIPTKIIK